MSSPVCWPLGYRLPPIHTPKETMRSSIATAALTAALFSSAVLADQPTCGPGSPCPASAPCCSQYGQCGVGAYCLGGCDPLSSHSLTSCVSAPTCQNQDYKLSSLDDVVSIDKYLGDASTANWVSSGSPLIYQNSLLLTMAEDTVGTLLASTHYVWYGKICAKMTTSQGAGVVTAFIMMSDVKDEIDFEFVGVDVQHAQSNYYSQGVTVYTNEQNLTASDTESTVHEYCIDWQEDTLEWLVDGTSLRTLNRDTTWNKTANRFDYPQTPSRIMLSLWPAGLPTTAKGTVDWAGGLINWNSPYMQNGYYYAMVQEVSVECYDPPSGANVQGSKSYIYTNSAGTNNTVEVTNNVMVLKSLYASGENPNYDPNASSQTGSAAAAATSVQVETVPGESGAGNQAAGNGAVSSGTASQATGSSDSSGNSPAAATGFVQNNNGAADIKGKALGGSIFAVWVGVFALFVL